MVSLSTSKCISTTLTCNRLWKKLWAGHFHLNKHIKLTTDTSGLSISASSRNILLLTSSLNQQVHQDLKYVLQHSVSSSNHEALIYTHPSYISHTTLNKCSLCVPTNTPPRTTLSKQSRLLRLVQRNGLHTTQSH